jgi:outer membrane protein assembly factor BamB
MMERKTGIKTRAMMAVLLMSIVLMVNASILIRSEMQIEAVHAEADPTDWWPMFHHDLIHSGYSTSTAPTTNHIIWTFQYDASANKIQDQSSPAVADGMVFIGSMNDYVYALHASTGGPPIWSYKTGNGILSSPAVDSAREMVFIGSGDNYVYALNEFSGGPPIWSYNTGGAVWASPTVADGMVFVGSMDGNFTALNEATGTVIWYYYTPKGWFESSAAVDDGMVFVGSGYHDLTTYDNTVYAFNETTGSIIWKYTVNSASTSGGVHSSPAVYDKMVFVGAYDGNVYILNEITGTPLIGTYSTGSWVWSSPAVANGTVFIGSQNGNIDAFSATTPFSTVWSYPTPSGPLVWGVGPYGVESSPAVADGMVFVGSCFNTFYALNEFSGGPPIWSYTTGGPVVSSPAVANGNVYVASDDGYLYAFGPAPPSPVGGYSFSLSGLSGKSASTDLIICYVAFVAAFGLGIGLAKRKKNSTRKIC